MKNKGFTLIELMIVMAIVGIFATIALSAIEQHRQEEQQQITQPHSNEPETLGTY